MPPPAPKPGERGITRAQERQNKKAERGKAQKQIGGRIRHGMTLRMASINCQGLASSGKRQEISKWIKENDIDIAVLQETQSKENTSETRDGYTWYFSSKTEE